MKNFPIMFTPEDADALRARVIFWKTVALGLGILVGILVFTT